MQAHKAHSLIGQIYDPRNLARAWERVKENKGAGGVDGVTVTRFDEDREHYLGLLQQRLKDGSYRPRPVRRVEIDKPGSTTKRALGIPMVASYCLFYKCGPGFKSQVMRVGDPVAARCFNLGRKGHA